MINRILRTVVALGLMFAAVEGVFAKSKPPAAKAPAAPAYQGAIVVDAATGRVLFEDKADAVCKPASVLKLMDLLILLEKVDQGTLKLTDPVAVTAEASKIGGSQVWLKEGESFSVDEMLYALMIQSANDAATALAIHVAGGKEAFVEAMNQRAKLLGMNGTVFQSVHGLPPSKKLGQEPDLTTPRDISTLCRELLKHPDVLRYTSTRERPFRDAATGKQVVMQNHNKLLGTRGIDGFKTGYYTAAGYSMAITAPRNGQRVIVVVMGSPSVKVRNSAAETLLERGFSELAKSAPPPAPPASGGKPK